MDELVQDLQSALEESAASSTTTAPPVRCVAAGGCGSSSNATTVNKAKTLMHRRNKLGRHASPYGESCSKLASKMRLDDDSESSGAERYTQTLLPPAALLHRRSPRYATGVVSSTGVHQGTCSNENSVPLLAPPISRSGDDHVMGISVSPAFASGQHRVPRRRRRFKRMDVDGGGPASSHLDNNRRMANNSLISGGPFSSYLSSSSSAALLTGSGSPFLKSASRCRKRSLRDSQSAAMASSTFANSHHHHHHHHHHNHHHHSGCDRRVRASRATGKRRSANSNEEPMLLEDNNATTVGSRFSINDSYTSSSLESSSCCSGEESDVNEGKGREADDEQSDFPHHEILPVPPPPSNNNQGFSGNLCWYEEAPSTSLHSSASSCVNASRRPEVPIGDVTSGGGSDDAFARGRLNSAGSGHGGHLRLSEWKRRRRMTPVPGYTMTQPTDGHFAAEGLTNTASSNNV